MQRSFAKLTRDGAPVLWLGANFWSRTGGPLMWRSYDGDVVRAELDVLRRHGLGMTRSFFYWPDMMPEPDHLDEELVARFADFLDLHDELGMQTVPTFIVGHMSGENWDPSWRGGRDLYADTWMVARQAWYARTLTARFAAHPAVAGWLVSNEMPIYGMAAPTPLVSSWAELMVQAIRAGGATQPVSLGDGAWGIEVTGQDNGFSVREIGRLVDFTGPHVYRMETDVVRQHLKAGFICELAAVAGRPVVLEEFGLTSDFASDENAAHYYRQALHLSLLGGATGWIAWNNTDYDNLVDQAPYSHHPFEMHFGITTSSGDPKPPLLELQAFREVLDTVDVARCERWPAEVALVVPSYLETAEPLTQSEQERTYVFRCLEQAHVAAREAGLPVGFTRETDGIDAGYRLYLVPSTKALTGPGWLRLAELTRSGATVFVSFGTGESDFQRGPWWTGLEQLFGVRHHLSYGLVEPITDDLVELELTCDLGRVAAGETLRFPVSGAPNARARLPVETTRAQVVARDGHGRVALTRNRHGDGVAYLCTYPLEYLAAARGGANPEDTWRLYDALADEAGVSRPVRVDDPTVLVDGLVRDDGRSFVWLVNESGQEQRVQPGTPTESRLVPLGGGDPVDKVSLPPYGVRVLELATGHEGTGRTELPHTTRKGAGT